MISEDELKKYANEPYLRWVRVSDGGDQQNSDEAQLEYAKFWADARKMIHVADVVSPNLSGSLPGNRPDMVAILKRADERGDFRFVISQRIDRATRGGADHLFWFEHELKRRGIRLLVPGDGLPEGVSFQNTLRAAKADAAQETAISTGQRTAQGSQYALNGRRVSPHSHTPFACHRLYCRADGTPSYVIVDKRNGIQEKRSWPELTLIDTYVQIGGGQVGHYRKQKAELVFLVPGDPYERETVNMIFRLRYIEGMSARKLIQHLNGLGRPAPRGGKWSPGQVESIWMNEDYTGRGIANRKSGARYFRRHKNGPQKVELDDKVITTAKRIPSTLRPKEDWFEGEEPYMADFLEDEEVLFIAAEQQKRHWDRRLDPTWKPKNKKKYLVSPYILHPLLTAKQDREILVGSRSGRPGQSIRHYRHKRGNRECEKGGIYGRMFNADALEKAVVQVLQEILGDWPELEERLLAHVNQQIKLAGQQDETLRTKREKREAIREQLLLFVRTLTPKTQADLAPEIQRLEAERDALDWEIEAITKQHSAANVDPIQVVSSLKEKILNLSDEVGTLPPKALKDVLAALTAKLEADMETKEVAFTFHLPAWMATETAKNGLAAMCMGTSSQSSTGAHTHHDPTLYIRLGEGTCRYSYPKHQAVDCKCSRNPKVAA